jgi:hypothetical protein
METKRYVMTEAELDRLFRDWKAPPDAEARILEALAKWEEAKAQERANGKPPLPFGQF